MQLDTATIDKLADAIVLRMKKREYEDNTLKFEDARYDLFHGKSRDWIKYYIFDKHPEVLTTNGGWITPPQQRGVRIKIVDVNAAKEWLKNHSSKINWNAPEPITLKRRMGLAKPIKRSK